MPVPENEVLKALLKEVFSRGESERRRQETERRKGSTVLELPAAFTTVALEDGIRTLESIGRDASLIAPAGAGRFFRLALNHEGALPLLRLHCDIDPSTQTIRMFRLYVALISKQGLLGIRFEMPESGPYGNDDFGRHNYYHAQLTKRIDGTVVAPDVWLPEHYPAFPLDAFGPASLVATAIIALYGMVEAHDVMGKAARWKGGFRDALEKMHVYPQLEHA